ncbi:ribose 5-phosphate isomerase A [Flammeovirgaceae bacterium SG7u.111]|nr:ribose 5-phosphate isomerase A [Flammeovirgaceae bacterium SG7u.132]WPO38596.1 ribose 5-phosphate isomerase A [Flammeovirgaceae bacterium SG7u.111]
MNWKSTIIKDLAWGTKISNREDKEAIAAKVVQLVKYRDVIGFGSGSTSALAIEAIGKRVREEKLEIIAIPTSHEVEMACVKNDIQTGSFLKYQPDWCFDGADEIDPDKNLIKGRGGAMVKEKLLMSAASKTYILADKSKFVSNLGEKFAVPIEVLPIAVNSLENSLLSLGASTISLRIGIKKDGPVMTENGNFILDVNFKNIGKELEKEINMLPGVLDNGLFMNFPIEVLTAN